MTTRPPGFGKIAGIVLAGGLSRRMGGGDKGLTILGGRPILDHVIGRFAPQVDGLAINANGAAARFAAFGLDVVADGVAGFVGPLAGVLAGLDWAAQRMAGATHVVTVPGDGPFLPSSLVDRLVGAAAATGRPLASVAWRGQANPVIGLWPLQLRDDLRSALAVEGLRKVDVWTARHGVAIADFSADPLDPFFNVNSPEDLVLAQARLAEAVTDRRI
jgi:molybdopterin-guanine dinucleotide biosynthesis protein A